VGHIVVASRTACFSYQRVIIRHTFILSKPLIITYVNYLSCKANAEAKHFVILACRNKHTDQGMHVGMQSTKMLIYTNMC